MKEFIRINLASPKKILTWTERPLPNGVFIGEVFKSETLDYTRFEPIVGGLFCQRIFGPVKDFMCLCKRRRKLQKRFFQKNVVNICSRCFVELTYSTMRSYRLGYISLSSFVSHFWFLRNSPSYISIVLNKSVKETLKIAYGKSYILMKRSNFIYSITGADALHFLLIRSRLLLDKDFTVLSDFNLVAADLKDLYKKRKRVFNFFIQTQSKPDWMILKYLPVLPPDIRPIVKISDNTIVTTDLNFSYANIINVNNKILKLRKMLVPERFLNNEKLFLQQKVDALISAEGKKVGSTSLDEEKKIKSLSSLINGKKGLFRENLLGKTVDYSARSVIVVEPHLDLNYFGIPEEIALELFQPFIIKKMFQIKNIMSIREGKLKILNNSVILKDLLQKVLDNHFVLLNRAPTLHRVGIQAFFPKLVSNKALKLHPLVCMAFNADFDGDQMGVHLPLSCALYLNP